MKQYVLLILTLVTANTVYAQKSSVALPPDFDYVKEYKERIIFLGFKSIENAKRLTDMVYPDLSTIHLYRNRKDAEIIPAHYKFISLCFNISK